jgi:hypothetical protein
MIDKAVKKCPLFDRPKMGKMTLLLFLAGIAVTGGACIAAVLHAGAYAVMLDVARMTWVLFIVSFAWLVIGVDLMKPRDG